MNKFSLLAVTTCLCTLSAGSYAVDMSLSGQADFMTMVYDDGRDTETNFADNSARGTLFALEGEQELENGLSASFMVEAAMDHTNTETLTQGVAANQSSTPTTTNNGLGTNVLRAGLGGEWGAAFIGLQATAADGTMKEDLGGLSHLMSAEVGKIGGGLFFRTSAGALSAINVASVAVSVNEENLAESLRYDSPIFNGLQASVSAEQGGDVESALRYSRDTDDFNISSAIGYKLMNSSATAASNVSDHSVTASFAVKHNSGLSGSVGYGTLSRDLKAATVDDTTSFYVKAGYEWGNYAVAADYMQSNDASTTVQDSEAKVYGLAGSYDMGHGVDISAMWHVYGYEDATATTYEDINIFLMNLGVAF